MANPAVCELLGELVACPSVNPGAGSGATGEAELVRLLSKRLADWGAEIQVTEALPGRPNLIATFPGRNPQRSLMLEAHSDTVSTANMIIPPFTPTIRDGRLYGRGACDTKGPMAAMLQAIRSVLDEEGRPPVTLHFVSTCDEELGARGAQALVAQGFRADAAVVGEPTGLTIVTAHKGAVRFRFVTHGIAVHSSTPERGVNAIRQMRRVLTMLEEGIAPAWASESPHPTLGHSTLSVGTIRGGTQVNIVPDRCEIEIDCRLLPGQTAAMCRERIERELEVLRQSDSRFRCDCEITQYYPPLDVAVESRFVGNVVATARQVLGRADLATAPYATNAGFFQAAGIPSVVLGPGNAAAAHTRDESIEIAELVRAVDLYAALIRCGE